MRALTKKLLRDLLAMRGQALAIALVVASGVAVYVSMMGAYDSLTRSRSSFYEDRRFADLFVRATRAPRSITERLRAIPGVARVMPRVVTEVTLELPGVLEPVAARLISLDPTRESPLNALHLRAGRLPEAGRDREVVVSEAFARARTLKPGDPVGALINGRREELRVAGIVLSPEYVDTLGPGQLLPDDSRFGVLWIAEEPLSAALDLKDAANDFSLALERGASASDVIEAVDRILLPYGGSGTFGRDRHPSDVVLVQKVEGIRTMATLLPLVFLGVAAFLLQVVLWRRVGLERTQIGTLKAFGYSSSEILAHYLGLALLLVAMGLLLGLGLGVWLGQGLLQLYARFYYFPMLPLSLSGRTVAVACLVPLVAALGGAYSAVRKAVGETPAQAMKPEAPAQFTRTWLDRMGWGRLLSPSWQMVLRNMTRQPGRVVLSVLGMAFAAAIVIMGYFSEDAARYAIDIQFGSAQSEDATIRFVKAIPEEALNELRRQPGVVRAEGLRTLPVLVKSGGLSHYSALIGFDHNSELRRLLDEHRTLYPLPREGLVLGRLLATRIGALRGSRVTVVPLEGDRRPREVQVAAVVDEIIGGDAGYMDRGTLGRLLGEERVITGVLVALDSREAPKFFERIRQLPAVASCAERRAQGQLFDRLVDQNLGGIRAVEVIMAAIIAFAVVYNNATIALSERSRELASLRVLGFSRSEVASILLGEMLVTTLVAIPLGLLLGYAMVAAIVSSFATDLMRIPLVVTPSTYAVGGLTVAISALLSALIVRRRVDQLDLVQVLKTRD